MFETSIGQQAENGGKNMGDTFKRIHEDAIKISDCPTVLTSLSHEMRTYMNAIVAFAFLMKEKGCDQNDREDYSKHIISSCEQMLGLFDSYFDTAIVETGSVKTFLKKHKLDTLFNEIIPEFRDSIRRNRISELELITEIQFNNSIDVFIDKDRIFRVIRSLFNNSVRNTNSGYIKIGHNLKDEILTFYILDSGQGYLKCREFLQSDDLSYSLTKFNDTYTAINIVLSRMIIKMLGGKIWIESNGLTGSGIYFSVPASQSSIQESKINSYRNTKIAI